MDVIKEKFGKQLKTIRNIKGYTQELIAEKIGINPRQLARIEAGDSFVKSETLYKICNVLEVNPGILFDFDIQKEGQKPGSDNQIYFSVIKESNVIKLVPKKEVIKETNAEDENTFDKRMLLIAKKIQKDVCVEEIQNGIIVRTKIYTQEGDIKIQEKNNLNDMDIAQLTTNIIKISNDKMKLEYMNLAFKSMYSAKALEQFKFLIKGLELGGNVR